MNNDYAKMHCGAFTRRPEVHTSKPKSNRCCAYGCPLVGSVLEGNEAYCTYHVGRPSASWQRITEAIHSDLALIKVSVKLNAMSPIDFFNHIAYLEQLPGEFKLNASESLFEYRHRFNAALNRLIVGE